MGGEPVLSNWYTLWGAATASIYMCVRRGKDAAASIECKSMFLWTLLLSSLIEQFLGRRLGYSLQGN